MQNSAAVVASKVELSSAWTWGSLNMPPTGGAGGGGDGGGGGGDGEGGGGEGEGGGGEGGGAFEYAYTSPT